MEDRPVAGLAPLQQDRRCARDGWPRSSASRAGTVRIFRPTRSLSAQTRLVDDLFGSLGHTGLLSSATSRTRELFTATQRDSLLDGERDDESLLADALAADVDGVVADRRLLSDLTSRQRLEREELDELFANADELLETFDQKLLE